MRIQHLLGLPVAFLGVGLGARAQTITTLVLEGDAIPGVGNVTTIDNMAVNNSGQWMVECDTDAASTVDGIALTPGGVLVRNGDSFPVPGSPGATHSSFDSVRMNNAGNTCWNHFLTGATTSTDSGVYWNNTLVLHESADTVAISGDPAPNPWTGFFEAYINDLNQLLVMGSVNEPLVGPSTTDRYLVRLTLDGTGAITSSTLIAREDDVLPGMGTGRTDDFDSGSNAYGFNNNGDAIFVVDVDTPVNGDKIIYTWIGGTFTPIAEEGVASFFDGMRLWDSLDRATDMNDSGHYVYSGSVDGDTTNDDVIVRNVGMGDTVFVREGDNFPAIATWQLSGGNAVGGGSSNIFIDNSGNVFWGGTWNNTDTTNDAGLFRNKDLLAQEGLTVLEGQPIRILTPLADALAVSDNGRYIVFECELADFRSGAFLIDMLGTPNLGSFCFGDGGDQLGCTDCPCTNNAPMGSGGGCLNSNPISTGARLVVSGTPDVTTPADTLHFDVLGANVSTFGILTSGDNRLPTNPANICFTQNPGSGVLSPGILDGLRCIGGNVVRHGSRSSDANGDIGVTTNGWGPPNNPLTGIGVTSGFTAGQTRHFQVFYREDAMSVCLTGQNTTQAVSVTFL